MATREMLERVKAATVALAIRPTDAVDATKMPFLIVGTGFCVDPAGIIVTCEHVIAAFSKKNIRDVIAAMPLEGKAGTIQQMPDTGMTMPEVLFFRFDGARDKMVLFPTRVEAATAKLDFDLGAIRISGHAAFPNGYPFLELEDFDQVYEGMEVATCGFPMGNHLHAQFGTKSSSFTRGIVSCIAPAPGAKRDLVKAYQLDITATFGNSGGPVFSWETGRVLGVLQGGPVQPDKAPLPGLARAEPIYRIVDDGTLERLRTSQPPPEWGHS